MTQVLLCSKPFSIINTNDSSPSACPKPTNGQPIIDETNEADSKEEKEKSPTDKLLELLEECRNHNFNLIKQWRSNSHYLKWTDEEVLASRPTRRMPQLDWLFDNCIMNALDYLSFHDLMRFRKSNRTCCLTVNRLRFDKYFLTLVRDKAIFHMKRNQLCKCAIGIDGFVMEGLSINFRTVSGMEQFVAHNDLFVFLEMVEPLIKVEFHIMEKEGLNYDRNHRSTAMMENCCKFLFMCHKNLNELFAWDYSHDGFKVLCPLHRNSTTNHAVMRNLFEQYEIEELDNPCGHKCTHTPHQIVTMNIHSDEYHTAYAFLMESFLKDHIRQVLPPESCTKKRGRSYHNFKNCFHLTSDHIGFQHREIKYPELAVASSDAMRRPSQNLLLIDSFKQLMDRQRCCFRGQLWISFFNPSYRCQDQRIKAINDKVKAIKEDPPEGLSQSEESDFIAKVESDLQSLFYSDRARKSYESRKELFDEVCKFCTDRNRKEVAQLVKDHLEIVDDEHFSENDDDNSSQDSYLQFSDEEGYHNPRPSRRTDGNAVVDPLSLVPSSFVKCWEPSEYEKRVCLHFPTNLRYKFWEPNLPKSKPSNDIASASQQTKKNAGESSNSMQIIESVCANASSQSSSKTNRSSSSSNVHGAKKKHKDSSDSMKAMTSYFKKKTKNPKPNRQQAKTSIADARNDVLNCDEGILFVKCNDVLYKKINAPNDGNCLLSSIAASDVAQSIIPGCNVNTLRKSVSEFIGNAPKVDEKSLQRKVVDYICNKSMCDDPKKSMNSNGKTSSSSIKYVNGAENNFFDKREKVITPKSLAKQVGAKNSYLNGDEISLIMLIQWGIDACILSNHANPIVRWFDPRRHYVRIFGEICQKPIKRLILYFHDHDDPFAKCTLERPSNLDHFCLLKKCPDGYSMDPANVITIDYPTEFKDDNVTDCMDYAHQDIKGKRTIEEERQKRVIQFSEATDGKMGLDDFRLKYSEFMFFYELNRKNDTQKKHVIEKHLELVKIVQKHFNSVEPLMLLEPGDLIIAKPFVEINPHDNRYAVFVWSPKSCLFDEMCDIVKIASCNSNNMCWEFFPGKFDNVEEYKHDMNDEVPEPLHKKLCKILEDSKFNPTPNVKVDLKPSLFRSALSKARKIKESEIYGESFKKHCVEERKRREEERKRYYNNSKIAIHQTDVKKCHEEHVRNGNLKWLCIGSLLRKVNLQSVDQFF